MRRFGATVAVAAVGVCLAGCTVTADPQAAESPPAVRIDPAVVPSESRPLAPILPTAEELSDLLGTAGFTGPLVDGGADALLAGITDAAASPPECVGPAYRLQKSVYGTGPVRGVASRSWAGGSGEQPTMSGFFGVVRFATPTDAEAFFAAAADTWYRCNGQTLVLDQRGGGASRITGVTVDHAGEHAVVSAVVMRDTGTAMQRALGVARDYVVDIEITDGEITDELTGGAAAGDTRGAVAVADLMLRKIG